MADTCSKRLFFCLISVNMAISFWLMRNGKLYLKVSGCKCPPTGRVPATIVPSDLNVARRTTRNETEFSANVCVGHGSLCTDPSVYPTFYNKPDSRSGQPSLAYT